MESAGLKKELPSIVAEIEVLIHSGDENLFNSKYTRQMDAFDDLAFVRILAMESETEIAETIRAEITGKIQFAADRVRNLLYQRQGVQQSKDSRSKFVGGTIEQQSESGNCGITTETKNSGEEDCLWVNKRDMDRLLQHCGIIFESLKKDKRYRDGKPEGEKRTGQMHYYRYSEIRSWILKHKSELSPWLPASEHEASRHVQESVQSEGQKA